MHIVRIFYRNRPGKDTKVLGWSSVLSSPVVFRGEEMSHPSNEFVLHVDLELNDISYQSTDSYGAFLKKIENGQLVNRLQADLDKDCAKKTVVYEQAEQEIEALLNGRSRTTWLMVGAYTLLRYIRAVKEAVPVATESLSQDGQTAKAELDAMESSVVIPVFGIHQTREIELAALDQED